MDGQRLDTLYYELEIRTAKFDQQIAAMGQRLNTVTEAMPTTVTVTADVTHAQREFTRLASSAAVATSAILAVSGAALKMADGLKLAENRLLLVTDSTGELTRAQVELAKIANDTYQSYAGTLELYARLARSTKDLGVSQTDLLDVTEATSVAVRLSAVDAQTAENALRQLGQAFASKELRGDELRAVLEQLPRLAEAIATGMGATVGELRKLAEAGKLTSETVFAALRSQLGALQEEAAKLPPTMGQALQVFTNEAAKYITGTADAADATQTLARWIQTAAEHFDKLAMVAALAGATFVGKSLGPMIAKGQELIVLQGKQIAEGQRQAAQRVEETAAALKSAQAEEQAVQARVRDLQATKQAIVEERKLAAARLQTANARLATSTAALANPAASGMTSKEAMVAQAAAQTNLNRAMAEMSTLGQQQGRVQRELTATTQVLTVATNGVTVAEGAHATAIAATTIAARAGTLAMTGLKTVMAFFGGPIGIAITAAIYGISYAIGKKGEAAEKAKEQLAAYQKQLESLTEAEVRAKLGQLEGERVGIFIERQRSENANPTAQNALSVREAEILDKMADLKKRYSDILADARRASREIADESDKQTAIYKLASEVLDQYGQRASKAIEKAAEKWADANRTFVDAYRAGDEAALKHLAKIRAQVDAEEDLQEKRQASSKALRDQEKNDAGTKDSENQFRDLKVAVDEYSASLSSTQRPMADFEARSAKLARDLEDVIQKLPSAQRASARQQAGTLMDQLAEAGERLRKTKAAELLTEITTVLARTSGDTVTQLRLEYAALIKQMQDLATASDALGTEESLLAAKRARESIPAIEQQRDAMIELEGIAKEMERSLQTIASGNQAANASYAGSVATITDYNSALLRLQQDETRLQELVATTTEGTEARRKAEELLAKVIAERKRIEDNGSSQPEILGRSVELTIAMGAGLRAAAQSGLALVQVLGRSNTELAQALAGAVSLASGIEEIGKAAKGAGGWKALFSGKDLMTAIPAIGQLLGGGIAIAQSLGIGIGESDEERRAKEVQRENTAALRDLSRRIGDLASSNVGADTFGRAQQVVESIVLQTIPFRNTRKVGNAAEVASAAGVSYDELEAIAKSLGITLDGTIDSFRKLYDAMRAADFSLLTRTFEGLTERYHLLSLIEGKAGDTLETLTNQFRVMTNVAPELAKAFDVNLLTSAEGRTQLRGQVAEILKRALTLDPNSAEAKALYESLGGLSPQQFLALFESIITGLDGMADAAEVTLSALDAFHAKAKLFGIEGVNYLTELVNTYAQTFPELGGLLDDIDLGTQAGRDALQQRLRDVYALANADGQITESEQKTIDALLAIMAALGQLPDILDPIAQAMEAFDVQAKVFGFTNAQKFQGRGTLLSAKNAGLAGILGSSFQLDILTEEGRAGLADRLKQGISDILADGKIDDAERPLLDALQELLDLVLAAMDDATKEADEAIRKAETAAQEREAARQAGLQRRAQSTSLTVALDDLEGEDAVRATFQSYSAAFAEFLNTFDLSSLAGIKDANTALKTFVASLDGLTDEEILAKWGMTREEITQAILAVDGGLDGLTTSLKALAKEQGDFINSIEIDFLNAIGKGLDAVKLQTELWVEGMIAQAKVLGVWTEELDHKIRVIGQKKIDSASNESAGETMSWEERVAAATAAAVANVTSSVASGQLQAAESVLPDTAAPNQRDEFVASDITRLSSTEALRMTDYLAMIHVEQRGTRLATEQIASMMSLIVGGSLPTIPIPRLASPTGSAGTPFVIQVTGPVIGLNADDVAEALAEKLFPFLNQMLYRDALREATNAGRPGLA